jgi:hypothetical protein
MDEDPGPPSPASLSRRFFILHAQLARKAWAEWNRSDPYRPTIDMLIAAGELEDRRKIAAYEARLLAGLPPLFAGKRKRRRT